MSYEPQPDGNFANLPPLRGTERQVAWAQQIRVNALNRAFASLGVADSALRAAACDQVEQALLTQDSASWWIEHRAERWDMPASVLKAKEQELLESSPWRKQ